MHAKERASARKQLDKRLNTLRNPVTYSRPPRGWIKAIREALGMTTTQFGKRLGVSQSTALGYEKSEVSKGISLATLERAAQALDCQLIYALVPREPFESMVEARARELAKKRLRATSHSMALEDQRVSKVDERAHLETLVQTILNQPGSALWENE